MFHVSLFKMSYAKIILLYFFVISTLWSQTLIRSQNDLGFHCFYLDITWKIHGILCQKRSGNPASVLTHFKFFITKICMKVPGIWHKKTWENLEFKTKNLAKTWNLVFEKVGTLIVFFMSDWYWPPSLLCIIYLCTFLVEHVAQQFSMEKQNSQHYTH